jgi:hypothetical protein
MLFRTRKPSAGVLALAGALVVPGLLLIAGCGSGGPSKVFQNAPPGFDIYTVNVAEPTDIILYFVNVSGEAVRLVSVSVPSASKAMQVIDTSVYDRRRIGYSPASGLGILPEECPRNYIPAPVSSLTVPAHSGSPWIASVTIRFDRPGTYWLSRFKIDYTTSQGSGWDYLINPVRLTVREPALPGPKPEPPSQC